MATQINRGRATSGGVIYTIRTDEAKACMSAGQLGNTNSKGNVVSAEARKKIGAAQLGNKHCVGRIMPPETRAKISLTKQRNSAAAKADPCLPRKVAA